MEKVFITGASRGLGLEFCRQLLARGDRVFAGARNPDGATELAALKNDYPELLDIICIDVSDQESIEQARRRVGELTESLDLLINNAGVDQNSPGAGEPEAHTTLGSLRFDEILFVLRVNSVAPLIIAQSFYDLLAGVERARLVNVSSILGSISQTDHVGFYSYYASKAALNMFGRILAFDLEQDEIITVLLHPGWVRTDMGGPDATLSPEQSVGGMIGVIDKLTAEQSARFWDYEGNEVDW